MVPNAFATRHRLTTVRPIAEGDEVRDWMCQPNELVLWPYGQMGEDLPIAKVAAHVQLLWPYRTSLRDRRAFGLPVEQRGLRWWDLREVYRDRLRTPYTIAFGEVATRNHFSLYCGNVVFKQTAPVIKMPAGYTHDEHLGLLGLLNASVACFWLKQVCQPKGAHLAGKRTRDERYAFNSTNVADFPVAEGRPIASARALDQLAKDVCDCRPASILRFSQVSSRPLPTRSELDRFRVRADALRRTAISLQEELDWHCYMLYGLVAEGNDLSLSQDVLPPEVRDGERAFEIVLARRMAAGGEKTGWFELQGCLPITELPASWPEGYRRLVQRRIDFIESNRSVGLIERPEYKRRWSTPAWADLEQAALREWLLDSLESKSLRSTSTEAPPQLSTTNRLADTVRHDPAFMQMAALYAGRSDFDLSSLVAKLVACEAVPLLPTLRYSEAGLRKRTQWQTIWAMQRHEDAGKSTDSIPVPPKYKSVDFQKAETWALRGALDLPKERWVSYPGCERGADGSLPIAWAGWNQLQQAMALASYFIDMKEREGWGPDRLQPLLAGLLELVPWLKQWHNEMNPEFGARMGDYYESFVNDEARALQFTLDDLRAWKPPATVTKRGRKKAA